MGNVRGQIVAGIECLPVVDVCFRPITLGCRLRATVARYNGVLTFHDIEITVIDGYLRHCAMRGDDWCIPFYYDHARRVMVGGYASRTFPVYCEVLPATTLFYHTR
jgi:hypothetical protein